MEVSRKINPPRMPNFLTFEGFPGKRQDGIQDAQQIAVAGLTEAQAEEFSEVMKNEFMKQWRNKQKLKRG